MVRIELDSAVPLCPLTSFNWSPLTGDFAYSFNTGIGILGLNKTKLKRKFWPLKVQLKNLTWCPGVIEGFGLVLAGISVENSSQVYLFDPLNGKAHLLFERSESNFTAVSWTSINELQLASKDGSIVALDLKTETHHETKITDCPILFMTANSVVDSRGRLFHDGKCILDDGIWQPSSLIQTFTHIWMSKFKKLYCFSLSTGKMRTWSLSDSNSVFKGACFVGELFVGVTDAKEYFFVEATNEMRKLSFDSDGAATPMPEQEDDDDENENDDVFETVAARNIVYGLASYKGRLLTVICTSDSKSAWIEIEQIETSSSQPTINLDDTFVKVSCPLCPTREQKLKTTATACENGHPISICSETLTRIDSPTFYRCRACSRCYKNRIDCCKVCGWFII